MEGPVINLLNAMCVALMLVLPACVSPATTHSADAPAGPLRVLTASDLQAVSARTLYDAVVELRPSFVRANVRGEPPTVFVNGFLAGSVEVLRQLDPGAVKEIQLLRGAEATARYGNVHTGSIIDVTLRSR
jgi:hypothetical protein